MDKRIKQKWLDALRSGDYEQGKFWLRCGNKEDSNFCCLGVLCDIYSREHDEQWKFPEDSKNFDATEYAAEAFSFEGESELLPNSVAEWAGFVVAVDERPIRNLADLNDKGKTFEEIANVIEKQF